MEELYKVKGLLNTGFVGQITYTVCLPAKCSELDICMKFSKQHFPSADMVPLEELKEFCKKEYGISLGENDDEALDNCLNNMKTEIHLMATLNDEFIGCIHKQLLERHMIFSPSELSEGCIKPANLEGVLKVTVLVFNVLMDETPYEVSVSMKREEK
jgi:hypothetical protein